MQHLAYKPENHLLRALSNAERQMLLARARKVELPQYEFLFRAGDAISAVWFVERGLVSLVAEADPPAVEIGMVGRDGMAGTSVLLDQPASAHTAIVQIPGIAYQVEAPTVAALIRTSPSAERLFSRYAHSVLVQVLQAAACTTTHNVAQRLAKWLLLAEDLSGAAEIPLTHDFLAAMLGTRRASVTDTLHIFEGEKLIRASRKLVQILHHDGLHACACGCYDITKEVTREVFRRERLEDHEHRS